MDIPGINRPKVNVPDASPDPDQVKDKLAESQEGVSSFPDSIDPQPQTDVFSSALNALTSIAGEATEELSAQFQNALTNLAQDAQAFQNTLQNTLGPFFNNEIVQDIRNAILRGDFSFLPRIDFAGAAQSAATGVLDAAAFAVQLPAQIASSSVQSAIGFVKSITDFVAGNLLQNQVSSNALFGSLFQGSAQASPAVSGIIGDPLGDAMDAGNHLNDVLHTIVSGPGAIVHGGIQTFAEGFQDTLEGLGLLFSGKPDEALGKLGEIAFSPFQLVFDSAAVLLVGATSAVQTLVGAEKPGRPLTEDEIASLRTVYGDSIDYSQIQVKEDVGGLLGMSGRAFTIGNTIYIPEGAETTDSLLVHEAGHAWQFQHGGLDYISDALIGRYLGGEGYNIGLALVDGKSWDELNPEQQAELLEQAFLNGFFESDNAAFMIRVTDSGGNVDTGGGFEVIVVEEGSDEYNALIEDGWTDATEQVQDGANQAQQGTGAT